ncbi:hypothetical protein [Candidatus Magnetominusculus xianensis]|uniref:Glycosyltransferase RgtA/B/C/D-like domain-containing protein n=1 Tax=Candidatus Magnetominusculus xianensis TaxID=1748249 RepID=A0ABR5SHL0_9BACT|nr:hypothetical protein [Candidatus Magnetominusculus xianensis]KWT91587.1 hypothetical protein ASN18_0868 [Candidatus Magnetominusculus xianensis]MBF0404372.1 hypothetical protein [Nitrospirota bacterium]
MTPKTLRYVFYWAAMSFLLVYSMSSLRVWDIIRSFNHPADRSKYLQADAQEYYSVAEQYQKSGQIVLKDYKLPLYPVFLLFCSMIDKRLELVFLIQKLLYIVSFFILACFIGEYINKALALFYLFFIYQYSKFPNQILTEGLAYGLIVLVFAFILRYLYKRDILSVITFSILTSMALLLRGNFIALLINILLLGIFVIQNRNLYDKRAKFITHLLLPSAVIFGVLFSWMGYQGLRTNQKAAYANYGWHNTATLVMPYYNGKDIEKGTFIGDIKSEILEIVKTNINPYEDFNTTTRFIQEVHDTREVLSVSCLSNREYPFCITENRKLFWFHYFTTSYYYRVIESVVAARYKQNDTNNIPEIVLSDMVAKDIVMEVLNNNPLKYFKIVYINFARIYGLPMSKEELLVFPQKLSHPLEWFFDNGYSVCFLMAGIVLAFVAMLKRFRFGRAEWFFLFVIFVNNLCLNIVISLSINAHERFWYLFLWMWYAFDFSLMFLLPVQLYEGKFRQIINR